MFLLNVFSIITVLLFNLILLYSLVTKAQNSYELTCRAKAKEVAVQTYSNCVTEVRNNKIQSIRSNYKKDLENLKKKYSTELKDLQPISTGNDSEVNVNSGNINSKSSKNKSNSSRKGIAKSLPTRDETKSLPLNNSSSQNESEKLNSDSEMETDEFSNFNSDESEVEVVKPN